MRVKPKIDAWHLPWTQSTVPHGLLDILRGCNITCRACYNTTDARLKSIREIEEELDIMLSLRRLHSIGIVGGEPTLHPGLCDIVRLIATRGNHVELFTNGVLLDGPLLSALKQAGVDLVCLHVEHGQDRPDLSPAASTDEIRKLREDQASLVTSHGMDVGFAITTFPDRFPEVFDAVKLVLDSPHAHFLLVTHRRDVASLGPIRGDLESGLYGTPVSGTTEDLPTNEDFERIMREQFGLRPFAYLGSNVYRDDPRWLSYLVGAVQSNRVEAILHSLRPSLLEPGVLKLHRLLGKGYPFYQQDRPATFRAQILLNGILGGARWPNLRFLLTSLLPGRTLKTKRILFQFPATIAPDGRVTHCLNCPDAVVKDGRLVPVCISDQVVASDHCETGG